MCVLTTVCDIGVWLYLRCDKQTFFDEKIAAFVMVRFTVSLFCMMCGFTVNHTKRHTMDREQSVYCDNLIVMFDLCIFPHSKFHCRVEKSDNNRVLQQKFSPFTTHDVDTIDNQRVFLFYAFTLARERRILVLPLTEHGKGLS